MNEVDFGIEYHYEGEELMLRGCIALPPTASDDSIRPAVVLAHGYKSFMGWGFLPELAMRLAEAGIVAVRFNSSGSGIAYGSGRVTDLERFGRNSYSQELQDLAQLRAFLVGEAGGAARIDPARLGLFGYSRSGGMILIHAAESGDYRAAAAWAPLPEVLRFSDEETRRWREQGFTLVTEAHTGRKLRIGLALLDDAERNSARLDIPAACGRSHTPTLLVAAERDRAVSPAEIQRLAGNFPEGIAETLTALGVGHAFGARHPFTDVPPSLERALRATVAHFTRNLLE